MTLVIHETQQINFKIAKHTDEERSKYAIMQTMVDKF